jgi:hypothetical protein
MNGSLSQLAPRVKVSHAVLTLNAFVCDDATVAAALSTKLNEARQARDRHAARRGTHDWHFRRLDSQVSAIQATLDRALLNFGSGRVQTWGAAH